MPNQDPGGRDRSSVQNLVLAGRKCDGLGPVFLSVQCVDGESRYPFESTDSREYHDLSGGQIVPDPGQGNLRGVLSLDTRNATMRGMGFL